VRRLHELPPSACRECEARKLEPRFAEFFAYIERQRRPTESFFTATQRVIRDVVFEFYGDDCHGIARALAVNPSTIQSMRKKRQAEAKLEAAWRAS
jgi:hypothetical protein